VHGVISELNEWVLDGYASLLGKLIVSRLAEVGFFFAFKLLAGARDIYVDSAIALWAS
jgi:hypothetical protein